MSRTDSAAGGAAHWEQRSADRVLDLSRDRLLARSRQFVEKATEVVARDGVDGLTLRGVLQETGLSRRAFYERFASKDDLLVAVFEETMRLAAERFRADLDAQGTADPLDRLQHIVTSMIRGAASGPKGRRGGLSAAMSREHLRLAESRPDELRQAVAPTTALMTEQLVAAMERGQVRQGDPQEMAVLIHNLVSSTVHSALLGSDVSYDGERKAELVWEFCRRGLAA